MSDSLKIVKSEDFLKNPSMYVENVNKGPIAIQRTDGKIVLTIWGLANESEPLITSSDELTIIYTALIHAIDTCDIFRNQDEKLKTASNQILDRITLLMEQKGLLDE